MKKQLLIIALSVATLTNVMAEEPVGWHVAKYIWGGAGFVGGSVVRKKAAKKALSHAKQLRRINDKLADAPENQDLLRTKAHHERWRTIWDVIAMTGLVGQAAGGYTILNTLWDRAMFARDKARHDMSPFVQEADLAHARYESYADALWAKPITRKQYLRQVKQRHNDLYDHYAQMGKQLDRGAISRLLNPFANRFKDDAEKDAAAKKYVDHLGFYQEKY